ncbi:MAG: hypothetical protein ACFFD1_13220, partial [Candidatus Thorarchaeota archaeon]
LVLGIIFVLLGSNVALGLSIGLFFPPHMALCLTLGGFARFIYNKRVGIEQAQKNGPTIGTGLAVGGSLVIPIMIILAIIS